MQIDYSLKVLLSKTVIEKNILIYIRMNFEVSKD